MSEFDEIARALLHGEESVWPEAADADAFLRAASEHGVAPLLYARIGFARRWPDRVVAALRAEAVRAAAVEPFRASDLRDVLDLLDENDVDALIVKGSALAYSLYPSPDLRPRGDTDLLIAAERRDRARDALLAHGFRETISSGDELALFQAIFTRTDAAGLAHTYDVHWAIANTPVFADVLRFDELRARAVALPALGTNARTISDVDALLYACVHRVAHHHDSDRLIWLADIHLLRDRMTAEDEARFWRLAAERRVIGVCIRSIEKAREWFGGAPHRAAATLDAATLARAEASRSFLKRNRRRGAMLAQDLGALRGWRARATRLRQLAFPPAAFMHATFRTRSRAALPFLYAYRALRGIGRLFRKV